LEVTEMKGYVLVLLGIAVGCAVGAAGFAPSSTVAQTGGVRSVEQYCVDTGDFNNVGALDAAVKKAGAEGFEVVAIARANTLGMSKSDYACFRRAR
jgi:hypothetical protein